MPSAPRVAIIFTGGTISMTKAAADGSAVPTLTGADIQAAVPELRGQFELDLVEFGQFPGPHMTVERMLALARETKAALARGATGVVIAHGTDTLEETAYLLDLLHDSDAPIVLVGAMRTRDELSWDGPVNLYSACLVVANTAARGRGAMVEMNNTINAACEVTKTFTEAVDTFVSPGTGPLGIVDSGEVIFYRPPVRRVTLRAPALLAANLPKLPRVELITATAGCTGGLVDAAVIAGSRGLVIAAMGRGNVPPPMAEAIERAMRTGVQVVVCSRCWGGRVAPAYGYEGGGARLLAAGAVFAPWVNGPKARLALMLALAAGYSREQLKGLFGSPEAPVHA